MNTYVLLYSIQIFQLFLEFLLHNLLFIH